MQNNDMHLSLDLLSGEHVRTINGKIAVGYKDKDGNLGADILLSDVLDTNKYNILETVYSSGHVFFDEDGKKVFLVSTEKDGKKQVQFTGGSPLVSESEYHNVFMEKNGKNILDTTIARENARTRTNIRTGAEVTEEFNPENPIIDFALLEKEDGYKLVVLIHFVVKRYEKILSHNFGQEYIVDAKWYSISDICNNNVPDIAPNVLLVTQKALDIRKTINDM